MPQNQIPDRCDMDAAIRTLIKDAKAAQSHRALSFDSEGMPRRTVATPPVAGRAFNLRASFLPNLLNADGQLKRVPAADPAAKTIRLNTGILAASRVAAAGARVILYNEPNRAIPLGKSGAVALERHPAAFHVIKAAQFATVADDADVATSDFPVSIADIDMSDSPSLGMRFEFSRAKQRDIDPEFLSAEIITSIVYGLARAADKTLLAHLAAASLADFSLAGAAAKDLKFGELQALIGTAADGAAVGADGVLRAAGVPGELTADIAATVVGAFEHSAVVIDERIDVQFERTSLAGDLTVTAWANMVPLLPDAGYFFTIPAAP